MHKTTVSSVQDAEMKLREAEIRMQTEYFNTMSEILQVVPRFAKDSDEGEWSSLTSGKHIYDEMDIDNMQESAMKLYYTDPTARGIIDMMVNFVVGRDAHITPHDDNVKVVEWWDAFGKKNNIDMKFKELVRRSFRDGEAFLRFFRSKEQGGKGVPLVRFVDPSDIKDPNNKYSFGIQTSPGDVEDVKYYWLKNGDKVHAEDMVHVKINVDGNVKRGVSFLVGIAKYIVKYGGWMDDRIMLNKIRTMFSLIIKVTGITPDTFKQKFKDVTRGSVSANDSSDPNKQMMRPGSVLVATPGVDYEFKNLQIHAPDTATDGRLIELQVAKGTGLTEYVVRADSSNSNYSSTMVAESPMVRMFEAWQDIFQYPMKQIFENVMTRGVRYRKIPKESNVECDVNFAALIHRDLKEETEAYLAQTSAQLVSKKTISEKLGYDYKSEKEQIDKELKEESENQLRARGDDDSNGGQDGGDGE